MDGVDMQNIIEQAFGSYIMEDGVLPDSTYMDSYGYIRFKAEAYNNSRSEIVSKNNYKLINPQPQITISNTDERRRWQSIFVYNRLHRK